MKMEIVITLRIEAPYSMKKGFFVLLMPMMLGPFGIRLYGRTLRKPLLLVMMEGIMMIIAMSFKCYVMLGSITLMMLAPALQNILIMTRSSNAY